MRSGALRCHGAADDRALRAELVDGRDETAVVRVAGEIDLGSARTLRDHMSGVLQAGFTSIVIDFRAVTFCDASGLNALVALANRTAEHGGGVWLYGVRPAQRRLFEITGLHRRVPIAEGVEDALTLAASGGGHGSGRGPENPYS
ncbi:STAS domain-containing protein [Actinocorallia sp. A-T 12471]|uniref:STAS domain-containing protein n=1 Tax=Actinocorallia sp. A-T 12471 TaxID=3089813 RepID=UPI0029D1394E|nr:STAS domain-containing protein [Actinocorallia sp. A-T 12471]MDX6745039.1 STAS domain-containing protein [Actinocorallia sp. A-T 12471]